MKTRRIALPLACALEDEERGSKVQISDIVMERVPNCDQFISCDVSLWTGAIVRMKYSGMSGAGCYAIAIRFHDTERVPKCDQFIDCDVSLWTGEIERTQQRER